MRSSIVFFAAAVLVAASSVFLNFSNSNSASAYPHPLLGNPHNAGMGIVGMSMLSTSYNNCNIELPAASADKWGESVTFKVPPGVADVVRAGEPDKPANYHIAFEGDDGLYYEVGIYYGDWSRDSGIGYNATRFQMAWGIGGILRGTSSVPVVAGHTLELSILYGPDKKWQVQMDDLDDSRPAQAAGIGHPSMKVKSDYFTFVEAGSFAPNTNTQRLGMVEVLNIQQATKGSGDKAELSAWTGGYLLMDCSPANSSYGVTYLGSTGKFKIGYEGATTKNGHQFW
ncbi:MAG: hypothetical protein ABI348_04645 [Nitrososphaera sp.]